MALLGVRVELSLREELGMGMRMVLEVVLALDLGIGVTRTISQCYIMLYGMDVKWTDFEHLKCYS